jgi:hypothetical protein
MEWPFYTRFVLLDRERDRRSSPLTTPQDAAPEPGTSLVCAACRHPITDDDQRIAMNGGHEHTFVNPGGFAYTIGCFADAWGCAHHGSVESAFSWFPGWTWQVAACAGCRAHLGWVYRNAAETFHGLILDRLRTGDA